MTSSLRIAIRDERDHERIADEFETVFAEVEQHLVWHRSLWMGFEADLRTAVTTALTRRREELARRDTTGEGLSKLGFKRKNG